MFKEVLGFSLAAVVAGYTLIGTSHKVDEIKITAPVALEERGFKVLRYEGFQYGSWSRHGGKVWYFVEDNTNSSIRYKVNVSSWNGELQFYYNEPEVLQKVDVTAKF